MDDFRIWFWVIILAIWIIRGLGKKNKGREMPAPRPKRRSQAAPEASSPRQPIPRGVTFEELLREIQASKERREEPAPRPSAVPVPPPVASRPFVDYDDDIEDEVKGEEAQSLEDAKESNRQSREETYKIYEDAKRQAFHRPSLEDTIKLSDTDTRFAHFKEYDIEKRTSITPGLAAELKDPKSFKRAFILSEILKPKFGR